MKMLRIIVLFSVLLSAFCHPGYAGMLNVSPTRLLLSGEQPITLLTLTNPNETPTMIQVQVLRWTQIQGRDRYQPTQVILATPPVFELPGNKSQIIRFALRDKMDLRTEQAYRVYLKEVVAQTRLSHSINSQLKVALNISIPLFVSPDTVSQSFVWKAKWQDNQHLQLQLYNTGNITLFTNQWQLLSADKPAARKQTVFSYIQPNQSQRWTVKTQRIKLPLSVSANINGQLVRAHVQVS